MLKFNSKKAFTLAELMVVLAIIGILSAGAMNIFSGAIAQARDSNRITDLNVMKTALESYYIKYKVYPQPAKQTGENVWGYKSAKRAISTCGVATQSGEILSSVDKNVCGGDVKIKEKKVSNIVCKYTYKDDEDANIETDDVELEELNYLVVNEEGNEVEDKITDVIGDDGENESKEWKILLGVYQFDNPKDVCTDLLENRLKMCEELDNNKKRYSCASNVDDVDDIDDIYTYHKEGGEVLVSSAKATYSNGNSRVKTIGWKGTLTENSGVNSIHESEEDKVKKSFSGFLEETASDPKYKSSKYKDFGFGFYPYAVFRDGASENDSKLYIGGTSYQIATTLEKQDDDGVYHPETLIIGNYKRPKNSSGKIKKGYPRSLFGNGSNVILSEQKRGEKAKYVKKPNGKSNRGVPYPVEEIE